MKKTVSIKTIVALMLAGSIQLTACKSKSKDTTPVNTDTTSVQTQNTAPVEIATDDSLTTGVKDATKDYPGVNALVSNGEVTLTGTIKRDRLQNLMQSIHALHPKKVNNNLTIQ
ncbi:MAG TPA: BON domain-containing protein [Flavisolibacter sp.]|jgi:osmotically-inducible protein OsmY|nr:BON domain-containing protein [Flavisolibacter sp.]